MNVEEVKAGFVYGHMPIEDWKNVADWIVACRKQGGLPLFQTHFAGFRWKIDNKNAVRAVCYAGEGEEMSRYFYNVPEEDIKMIEEKTGDWYYILQKYAPEKLEEAKKYPLILKGIHIPKVLVKSFLK